MRRAALGALVVTAFAAGCGGGEREGSAGDAARAPEPAEGALASYRPLPPLDVTHLDGRPADLGQFHGQGVACGLVVPH